MVALADGRAAAVGEQVPVRAARAVIRAGVQVIARVEEGGVDSGVQFAVEAAIGVGVTGLVVATSITTTSLETQVRCKPLGRKRQRAIGDGEEPRPCDRGLQHVAEVGRDGKVGFRSFRLCGWLHGFPVQLNRRLRRHLLLLFS